MHHYKKEDAKIGNAVVVKKGKKLFWVGWIFLDDYAYSIIY